jgi:hypothetical protein
MILGMTPRQMVWILRIIFRKLPVGKSHESILEVSQVPH